MQAQTKMGTPDMSAPVPTDTETKEAMEFWGYLFKSDKCGTEMLNRLLRGIAIHVVCAHRELVGASSSSLAPHRPPP